MNSNIYSQSSKIEEARHTRPDSQEGGDVSKDFSLPPRDSIDTVRLSDSAAQDRQDIQDLN